MASDGQLQRELARLFGEDAELASNTYLQMLRVLRNLALCASEENARLAQQYPTLAQVYTRESEVFEHVAQELRRAATKIEETLAGTALIES